MFKCVICKAELIEYSGFATCTFCGAKEEADYICPNGHSHSIKWNDFQQGNGCSICRLAL